MNTEQGARDRRTWRFEELEAAYSWIRGCILAYVMNRTLIGFLAAAAFLLGPGVGDAVAGGVETVRIYRLYQPGGHNDHMSSHNQYEASSQGYYAESSTLFYSQPHGGNGGTPANARPIYRCYIWGWDHMTSTSSNCEGAGLNEGRLGYLLTSPRSGHAPLYRCRQSTGEHFNSFDPNCEGSQYVTEYILGYARTDGNHFYHKATLSSGSGSNDCFGRCGLGCSWMPWEAWTSECYEHDQCVAQHGHLACLGVFADAAISYVEAGVKQLVKAVADIVSSIFDWF